MTKKKKQKPVEQLEPIIDGLLTHFEQIDAEREDIYKKARELRRTSTRAVREVHKGSPSGAKEMMKGAIQFADQLSSVSNRYNFVEEALQEYAETSLLLALLEGKDVPDADRLRVTERGYLLGLADCVGELRRHVLGLVRKDSIEEAEDYVDMMEDIFYMLMKFDQPDAVLPMRRKQDQIRPIIERTRAELTMVKSQRRLERKLAGHLEKE
ncbi:MAG: hypothetical protein ABIH66_02300 [bacterium]